METKHNPIVEMVLHRETLWHSAFEPVTSECKFMSINHGRWAGIMDLKHPSDEIIGRAWVLNYDTGTEEEYPSLAAAAAAIGLILSVRQTKHGPAVGGYFNTSLSTSGKRHVLRVEAEVRGKPRPLPEYHTREEMETMLREMYLTMREEMYTVMDSKISTVREGVTQEIDGDVATALDTAKRYTNTRTAGRNGVARWKISNQRFEGNGATATKYLLNNYVEADSTQSIHFRCEGGGLKLRSSGRNRLLRVTLNAYMDIGQPQQDTPAQWWLQLRSQSGSVINAQAPITFIANGGNASFKQHGISGTVGIFVPSGENDVAVTNGYSVVLYNGRSRAANVDNVWLTISTISDDYM